MKLKPVQVDGTLYICIACFVFIQSYFTSDESYKYVSPYFLFWMKFVVGLLGTIAGALKMFRSTSYAESLRGPNAESRIQNPEGGK